MRLFAVLVAICALSHSASAQTGECKSISNEGARLACYDKATPPAAAQGTAGLWLSVELNTPPGPTVRPVLTSSKVSRAP